MCEWGTHKEVLIKIPADQSSTGKDKAKWAKIDACIADLVEALQAQNIIMRGSCCGHGQYTGYIRLADGRVLLIVSEAEARQVHNSKSASDLSGLDNDR